MELAFLYYIDQSKISRIMARQRNQRIHFQTGFFGSFDAHTHRDPRNLGLICLVKKLKIYFRILSDLRIQSRIFLKKRTLTFMLAQHLTAVKDVIF